MAHNPKLDADLLADIHRDHADIMEQIRLTQETIGQSQELLKQVDEMLAKSPLKP